MIIKRQNKKKEETGKKRNKLIKMEMIFYCKMEIYRTKINQKS